MDVPQDPPAPKGDAPVRSPFGESKTGGVPHDARRVPPDRPPAHRLDRRLPRERRRAARDVAGEPGSVARAAARGAAREPRVLGRRVPRPRRDDRARPLALAAPALLRLLPVERRAVVGARRLPEHRPRRARPVLAVEPRADRARGGRHRLGAPDGRAVGRLERRHPGHRLDQHAGRAPLRARADVAATRSTAGACRARSGRSSSTSPSHEPQLGREGGAARGLRPRQRAHASPTDEQLRHARRTRSTAAIRDGPSRAASCPARSWPRPAPPPPRALDPLEPMAAAVARRTGSGCTWTRPWPARR